MNVPYVYICIYMSFYTTLSTTCTTHDCTHTLAAFYTGLYFSMREVCALILPFTSSCAGSAVGPSPYFDVGGRHGACGACEAGISWHAGAAALVQLLF